MPLVDDELSRTDRRTASWWPWVLVALGFALVWLLFAVAISILPRVSSSSAPPSAAPAIAQTMQSDLIRQAQRARAFGGSDQAIATLERIDPQVPMSLSDKHTYFRVAAESYRAAGKSAKAVEFYDRFLSLSVRIHQPECRSCHNAQTEISPTRLADMLPSELGKGYTAALTEARKLRSTRNTLAAQLERKRDDLRLRLLLYHLETALENPKAAKGHARVLRAADQESGP